MKKKSLFLFISLVILAILGSVLFYKIAQWYEQVMGYIFSYVIIIVFILFIFTPFKFIKDKKARINMINYIKYMGVTILALTKLVANIVKQIVFTISYLVSRLFIDDTSKEKDKFNHTN